MGGELPSPPTSRLASHHAQPKQQNLVMVFVDEMLQYDWSINLTEEEVAAREQQGT